MTNLPADLPENWTRGQLVSPNGTEVGLTTQHGYNYLMAQVNAAQTAINNIVESLGEVAQETSVQDILMLIGATTDTGGSTTAGSLFAKDNAILTFLNNGISCIKGIQYGYKESIYTTADTIQISISRVNPDKCIVILNASQTYNPSNAIYVPCLKSIAARILTVTTPRVSGNNNTIPFSWQVLELN